MGTFFKNTRTGIGKLYRIESVRDEKVELISKMTFSRENGGAGKQNIQA